jgi:transcriptional regulator with AAA-type ATPase domain
MTARHLLVLDGSTRLGEAIRQHLGSPSLEVTPIATGAEMVRLLDDRGADAIIGPEDMLHSNGNWQFLQSRASKIPVLGLQSPTLLTSLAVASRRTGVPVDPMSFLGIFAASTPLPPVFTRPFPSLIGSSAPMQQVFSAIAKVAAVDSSVCIYGESGTGKELVARAIHYSSRRASQPLVVFDCSAVPEGLMESEMFGHVKGSFTSAVNSREGLFELASGGSLFLDEITELGPALQAKLLRVLQAREFRRVGGKDLVQVNVRIMAATNQHLRGMVAQRQFRSDLLYRLEVIPINLPPLREREGDLPLLVAHFLLRFNRNNVKQVEGVTPAALVSLLRHPWPGNVRELENCIERAAGMTDGTVLDVGDLAFLLEPVSANENGKTKRGIPVTEQELIRRTLRLVNGNRLQAARLLGISVRTLYYRLRELEPAPGSAPLSGPPEEVERGGTAWSGGHP